MATPGDPILTPVAIEALRPTQMTVGMREVERKRAAWRAERDAGGFLGRHMIPAVLGPHDRHWIVDNHHLARALHEEGVERVLVRVVADLRRVPGRLFRTFLDNRGWLHPYDARGRRRAIKHVPHHIGALEDDPYRSLAGALRRAGGYAKVETPYAEFLWADFLRRHVPAARIDADFDAAVEAALAIAHGRRASYLPGWAGAVR